jgi:hypothetical protein
MTPCLAILLLSTPSLLSIIIIIRVGASVSRCHVTCRSTSISCYDFIHRSLTRLIPHYFFTLVTFIISLFPSRYRDREIACLQSFVLLDILFLMLLIFFLFLFFFYIYFFTSTPSPSISSPLFISSQLRSFVLFSQNVPLSHSDILYITSLFTSLLLICLFNIMYAGLVVARFPQ